jgi:proton-dependent oligopeptide transporter, POT family
MSLSQPRALTTLFFTEMWERFSYYGMRALLVLYLVKSVGFERADALTLYASYTGMVYLAPVLGGYLCDRYLGYRKSILLGGIIMMLGHFAMAFPALLYYALGLLVIGNGFFKPNITTFLGTFYQQNDPRRDGGFTFFYMGINLGAFLAPLIAGTLGEKVGWDWGFASAGVGMALGLTQFWLGQNRLEVGGYPPGRSAWSWRDVFDILAICAAAVALLGIVFQVWPILSPLLAAIPFAFRIAVPLALLAWMVMDIQRHDGSEARDQVLAILVLCAFVIVFWMGFEQAGGTMSLFADQQTDRHLGGWEIPASYFQAINPLGILLFGPLFSMMWGRWDVSRFALSTPAKMALGMIILGLGFVVLFVAQKQAEQFGTVGPFWLVAVYLLHTLGELCLSPIGLSMVTKLAPIRVASLIMGTWFIANGVANYFAGRLESLLATDGIPVYGFLIASSIGSGVLLLALTPLLKRWMHGKA